MFTFFCVCLCIVVSNTYCVAFLFWFSLFCVTFALDCQFLIAPRYSLKCISDCCICLFFLFLDSHIIFLFIFLSFHILRYNLIANAYVKEKNNNNTQNSNFFKIYNPKQIINIFLIFSFFRCTLALVIRTDSVVYSADSHDVR